MDNTNDAVINKETSISLDTNNNKKQLGRPKGKRNRVKYFKKIKILHQDITTIHDDINKMHKDFNKNKVSVANLIIYILTTILILMSIFFIFLYKNTPNIIDIRKINAKYGLIEDRANYLIIMKQTQMIEKSMSQIRKVYGKDIPNDKKLTPEEFEKYSIALYIGKVFYDIDIDLFLANTSSESEWNKKATSYRNAKGLNQILDRIFEWINKEKLDKYKNFDIYDVYHNTEASIRLWFFNMSTLEYKLKRRPKPEELAWAYHCGADTTIDAINSNNPEKILASDTLEHGQKVMFYYNNYKDSKFNCWWFEQYYTNNSTTNSN